jgi:hypothetical protein
MWIVNGSNCDKILLSEKECIPQQILNKQIKQLEYASCRDLLLRGRQRTLTEADRVVLSGKSTISLVNPQLGDTVTIHIFRSSLVLLASLLLLSPSFLVVSSCYYIG